MYRSFIFFLIGFLFLTTIKLEAQTDFQKDNALWFFGEHTGVRWVFPAGGGLPVPEVVDYSPMIGGPGETSVLNKIVNGRPEVEISTNGLQIYRADESLIGTSSNVGTGLENGFSSDKASCSVIIPAPQNDSLYYVIGEEPPNVIYTEAQYMPVVKHPTTNIFDFRFTDSGVRVDRYGSECIAMAKGKCGNLWYIKHFRYAEEPNFEAHTGKYYGYKLDQYSAMPIRHTSYEKIFTSRPELLGLPSSLGFPEGVMTSIGPEFNKLSHNYGKLRVSMDSEKIIHSTMGGYILLSRFDRASGKVYDLLELDTLGMRPYGVSFSPDDRYIYVTESDSLGIANYQTHIYQYDITTWDKDIIIASKTEIGTFQNSTPLVNMQVTPDFRIFIGRQDKNYLSSIDQPNVGGIGCDFKEMGFSLGTHIYKGPALHNRMVRADDVVPDRDFSILPQDTVVCAGATVIIEPEPGNVSCAWAKAFIPHYNAPNPFISIEQTAAIRDSGVFYVRAVQNDQCIIFDSIQITWKDNPVPDLGQDTTFCLSDTVALGLVTEINDATLSWNDGTVGDSLSVTAPGTYWVDATALNCTASDSIIVSFDAAALPDLGVDTSFCEGAQLILVPDIVDATLEWNDGSTADSLSVTASGVIWVEAEKDGCRARDSIRVEEVSLPVIDLGVDTTLCVGATLLVNANGLDIDTYLWSDNTEQATLEVSAAGEYWVEIQKANCSARDTVNIGYYPHALPELGQDTSLCEGDLLILSAADIDADSYAWNSGATTSEINVGESGTYGLEIEKDDCLYTDSVLVTFETAPEVNLGQDTILCVNANLVLANEAIGGSTFLWQDGSQDAEIIVESPGLYWLESKQEDCASRDSIVVSIYSHELPNLGDDIRLCVGDTVLLSSGVSDVYDQTVWSDGSTNPTLTVDNSGIYSIEVEVDDCAYLDQITVEEIVLPVVDLGLDIIDCLDENLVLDLGDIDSKFDILWQDGSIDESFEVSSPGIISVTVSEGDCQVSDSLMVSLPEKDCNCSFYFPNIILPERASESLLLPQTGCAVESYLFQLYDRWGNTLFVSDSPTNLDSGRLRELQTGVYTYSLSYTFLGKEPQVSYGTVTIL